MYSVQDHYLSKTTATKFIVQSCGLEKSALLEKLEPYSDFLTSASESLTHKNPQRHKIICGIRPVRRKDRLINLKLFLRIPCLCDFCGCCLTTHISFSLFCA